MLERTIYLIMSFFFFSFVFLLGTCFISINASYDRAYNEYSKAKKLNDDLSKSLALKQKKLDELLENIENKK